MLLAQEIVRNVWPFVELGQLRPLLDRARKGIEFFGISERAQQHWNEVKRNAGLQRFAAFCRLMGELAECTDYRLLSSVQMQSLDDDAQLDQINTIVQRIMADVAQLRVPLLAELGVGENWEKAH